MSSPMVAHNSFTVSEENMHEELVARVLSISSARLAIFDATAMGKMPGLARVVQDSRLRDHFKDQCVFVSCQGASSSDVVIRRLSTELGISRVKFPTSSAS